MTTQNHIERLSNFIEKTQLWQDKFVPQFDQLNHIKNIFIEKIDRFSQEEQTLNIAIMGQVKAGKSSFLNALLFNTSCSITNFTDASVLNNLSFKQFR